MAIEEQPHQAREQQMPSLSSKKAFTFVFLLLVCNAFPQIHIGANTFHFMGNQQFESFPILHSVGERYWFPQAAFRHLQSYFDVEKSTLHIAGWYYRHEDSRMERLMHIIVRPGQDVSAITAAESGDINYPILLSSYGKEGVRIIWRDSDRFNQYIWRDNQTISRNSFPPLSLISDLEMVQDAQDQIHVMNLNERPLNETRNLLTLFHSSENSTKWIEEEFSLIPIRVQSWFRFNGASILPNGTIMAIVGISEFNEIAESRTDRLLLIKLFEGNLTAHSYFMSDEPIFHVQFIPYSNNSVMMLGATWQGLRRIKLENSSSSFESLNPAADTLAASPFRWKLDSNNRLIIAYIRADEYSEVGILSILQQTETEDWIRYDVDSDHGIIRDYEGEDEAHFAMEMLNDSPILVYVSSPTNDELDALNVAQEDICSLYIAQKKDNALFTDFKPARIDLSSEEDSLLEMVDIWLLIPAIALLAIVAIAIGVFLRKLKHQKR
ncbi:MAG: hypothetical protein ACXACI_03650 [Candidatus Hodarchaeales archaeon]